VRGYWGPRPGDSGRVRARKLVDCLGTSLRHVSVETVLRAEGRVFLLRTNGELFEILRTPVLPAGHEVPELRRADRAQMAGRG
jgi:hypothetical protein